MSLFPGPYIHVGGDEALKDEWKENPDIQAEMKSLGIANEEDLQSWFISRIGAYITSRGRKMVGWDEILQGGIPPDSTIMSWRGIGGAIVAVKAQHDAILSPAPTLYFDNRQGSGVDEPPGRGYILKLEDVYAFDPIPATLSDLERAHILGLQANIWTEHISLDRQVSYMAFPRAAALAEVAWSSAASHDWSSFGSRMAAELDRYRALGIVFAPSAFEVNVAAAFERKHSSATIFLSTQAGLGDIYFTLDETEPSEGTQQYSGPFSIKLPAKLKAVTILDGRALTIPVVKDLNELSLQRRDSHELELCSDALPLSLAGPALHSGVRSVYLVDILNPCWIDRKIDFSGLAEVEADVGHLPFNFSIGAKRDAIRLRRPRTDYGELEVRLDNCDGVLIADLPLKSAISNGGITNLSAKLAPMSGTHDICLEFTQNTIDPLWVLHAVKLLPSTQ
jgi:hexosaminidase